MSRVDDEQKKQILRLALYAGEIMLRSGAETYRVEDTISRICQSRELNHISAFVTPTVIMVSDERFDGYSFIKRIKFRHTDISKISLVNDFSRSFINTNISADEGLKALKEIDSYSLYSFAFRVVWAGLASGMFAMLFGGLFLDFIAAFFISMGAMIIFQKLETLSETSFLANAAAGFVIGVLAFLLRLFNLGNSLDMIIIGSIMPLLPGVALTNGIRDFISGDLLSGISRVFEAALTAISIAVGVGAALKILLLLGGVV